MDPVTFLWTVISILVVVLTPLVIWSLSNEKAVTNYIPDDVQKSGAPIAFMFRHHVAKLIGKDLRRTLPPFVPTVFTESGLDFYLENKRYSIEYAALDDVRWYNQTARFWVTDYPLWMTRAMPLVVWVQGHSQELVLKKWDDYSKSLKPLQYYETEQINAVVTRFRNQRKMES